MSVQDFLYRVIHAKAELHINANVTIELTEAEYTQFMDGVIITTADPAEFNPADIVEIDYGGITVRKM